MSSKQKRFMSLAVITHFALVGLAFAQSNDPNTYVFTGSGSAPLNKRPGGAGWTKAEDALPITVPIGGSICIGLNNTYDEKREKIVNITLKGTGSFDGMRTSSVSGSKEVDSGGGKTEVESVDAQVGREVDEVYEDGKEGLSSTYLFEPQPDWEIIEIVNDDPDDPCAPNAVTIEEIKADSLCFNEGGFDPDYYYDNANVGLPAENIHISKFFLGHETENVNSSVDPNLTVHDGGSGTWTHQYVVVDPDSGEALPQGGWLWTLLSGSGIDYYTYFDIGMTMEGCKVGGNYLFYSYDTVGGRWQKFVNPADNHESRPEDITGDCMVDLFDLRELGNSWLDGVSP